MKYTNESGRSMVEMLGVLAIIGVLSVGGIAGYSKAMNKFKINKTTDQVSMLVANIRTLFSAQGDYDGLTNEDAKKFGIVPNDMFTSASNSTITNAFGGEVTIAAAALNTGTDNATRAFTIEYGGLSQEACVTIATGDWGSGQASGLIAVAAASDGNAAGLLAEVYVGDAGGSGYATPGGTQGNDTPMSVKNALTYCSDTSSGNAVAWKYY